MTEVLPCAAVGTYDQWFTWPTPDKPANVASPDDETSSGIGAYTAVSGRQSFTLGPSAIPPGDVIYSVTVHGRMTWDNIDPPSTFQFFLRLGGIETYGPTITARNGALWYDEESLITRPGGGPWSLADLAALEIGIWSNSGDWSWCTTLYARADYNPPAPAAGGDMLLVMP